MFRIKDDCVIGGDKVVTVFGELIFERIYETDDADIAEYFRNKIGFTVTETDSEKAS